MQISKNTPKLPKNGSLNCPAKGNNQPLNPMIEINQLIRYPLALPDDYVKSLFKSSKSNLLCDKKSVIILSPTDAYSKAYEEQELSKEDCEKSCANNNECKMYAHGRKILFLYQILEVFST